MDKQDFGEEFEGLALTTKDCPYCYHGAMRVFLNPGPEDPIDRRVLYCHYCGYEEAILGEKTA